MILLVEREPGNRCKNMNFSGEGRDQRKKTTKKATQGKEDSGWGGAQRKRKKLRKGVNKGRGAPPPQERGRKAERLNGWSIGAYTSLGRNR